MDSGTVVEDKVVREIQRYSEGKVYTRKVFKVSEDKVNSLKVDHSEDKVNSLKVDPHTHSGATTATVTVDGTKDNGNNVSAQQLDSVLVPEDGNSALPVVNSRLEVVSEDSSSLYRKQDEHFSLDVVQLEDGNDLFEPALRCNDKKELENGVKNGLASRSKQEMREIKRKLEGDLETVRSLVIRIEEKQRMAGRFGGGLNVSVDRYRVDNGSGAKRAHSEVASAGVPREANRFTRQLSVMVLENGHGISESVEKEKRTPKANQFYSNSEFLLAKDKFPPAESNKKSKSHGKKHGVGEMGHGFGIVSKYLKNCSSLLEKLMKHKHGWVFNTPVDVERLGLHDYFIIISQPMDLGTVKSRLSKNWYKSPKEFAEDVRLTFRNAMTYNPKGQDVHVMAEELSALFEERWAIIESHYNHEMRYGMDYGPAISAPSPLSRKAHAFRPPPLDMRRIDRSDSITKPPNPMSLTRSARTPAPKKPKANDPDKRDMTYYEKQKLSTHLQNLPPDKLDAIVQIIKKQNSALSQHDDEIEVDIDSVDAETLWELDRYVTNYKKSLSKYKRKAELAIQARAEAERIAQQKSQEPPVIVEAPRERQADERNDPSSLPVQGEIRVDNGSKTSSSSSSSSDSGSSSSDSDSDSSSASGSDAGSQ
ncbi:putative chromatin remodeler Bromodomain family [Medicago truncatula]|uniref:Putative chromatin remodeler Bromodomain family n=1 Tax=Medicago truncatula TaxID=3880 RepID=A0A072VCR8_MEDTR|nr:transcription factor GTE4 [Medicago truncatula]KEH39253.1 transcription factor GTE4-like protein [Medicago truncatula]RHN75823.1 putative chromatin remodeler Bromodomain family [Medicago truncatula]